MRRKHLVLVLLLTLSLCLASGCSQVPAVPDQEEPESGFETVQEESSTIPVPDLALLDRELSGIIDSLDRADGEILVYDEDGQTLMEMDPEGFVSIYYEDLETGASLSLYPEEFYPCSMVKIVCMLAVYDAIREGKLEEEEVKEYLKDMILWSDNTSFNVLVQAVGKDHLRKILKEAGTEDTVISHGLLPGDAFFESDAGEPENTMTARDIGRIFRYIYEYPDEEYREKMITLLEECEDDSALAQGLPSDVVFAHKTGWADPLYHDGGIVYADDGGYILVMMTNGVYMDAFEQVSEAVYAFQTELNEQRTAGS